VRRISPLSWLFIVVGILLIVVAIVYFGDKADSLPSFFPGHVKPTPGAGKYTKRGTVAIIGAVVSFVIAVLALRKD
jgi:hypothetical protein